jgi:phage I-like protein
VLPDVLKAVRERADMADCLQAELDTLTCAAEQKRKDELIARGLQEGKLTNALAENWAKEQDCAVLAAYLEHAPAAIPGRMELAPNRKAVRSLSEADEAMIRKFGFDKDEYQQAKLG